MIGPRIIDDGDGRVLPGLESISGAGEVLAAAQELPVARVVDRLADELSARLRTDVQDDPGACPEALVRSRYRILARMAHRYRSAAGGESRPGRLTACLMLAAVHRVADSDRLRVV